MAELTIKLTEKMVFDRQHCYEDSDCSECSCCMANDECLFNFREERKIGKWENDKLFGECAYVCSFCHTIWTSSEIENMHYCPTCGTEMKGESNNDNT